MIRIAAFLVSILLIAGCAIANSGGDIPQINSIVHDSDWSEDATENDKRRLEKWEEALELGKAGAIAAGHEDKLKARAPLFDLHAAMPDSKIPAGLYSCSITKLDEKEGEYRLNYIAYPAFRCRVVDEGGQKHFTKLTGSQRSIGWISEVGSENSIFLGTLIYGYEDALTPYGETPERDEAAVVHRIGTNRWRMIFPFPYYESIVNVMELTPIKAEKKE